MLKIIENSGTDYVLSVPSYVYESNREDIVYLQRVLVEKYGVSPHVSSEGKHKIGFVREGDSLDYSISVNEETGDILNVTPAPDGGDSSSGNAADDENNTQV